MLERLRRGDAPRIDVAIVGAVALASIATGLAAMVTGPAVEVTAAAATIQLASSFTGAVLGFGLLAAAWGMRRGYRLAYLVAAALVALEAVHGVVHAHPVSIPLVALSVAGFVVLVRTGRAFTRSISLTETQIGAAVAVVAFVGYGTVGAYVLRAEFAAVDGVVDALYFTLVTASTVGFGDVHPVGDGARLFTISLVALGPATVAAAIGTVVAPALEARLSRTGRRVARAGSDAGDSRDGRVVVLGDRDPGTVAVDALADRTSLAVVTADEAWARDLDARGVETLAGAPTDDDALERADLASATAAVVATDGETAPYAVLAARRVAPAGYVVALAPAGRAGDLEAVGADVAVDPREALASATAGAVLGGETERG